MQRIVVIGVIVGAVGTAAAVIGPLASTNAPRFPDPLVWPAPIADTRQITDAAAARAELAAASPALVAIMDAIAARDADTLLSYMEWRTEICGLRRDVHCGDAKPGEPVRVTSAGPPVPFYVPEEVLRASLEQALAGSPLQLRFASQLKDQPSVYRLGFDGTEIKGKGKLPLADPSTNIIGLFFAVDVSRQFPILYVTQVAEEAPATKHGSEIGLEAQRLIVFEDLPVVSSPSPSLHVDVDTVADGAQTQIRLGAPAELEVHVVLEGVAAQIASFQFKLIYDDSALRPLPGSGGADGNPGVHEPGVGVGWNCSLPVGSGTPDIDSEVGPGHGVALLVCFRTADFPLVEGTVAVATFRFEVEMPGTHTISFGEVHFAEPLGGEIGSCEPDILIPMQCTSATIDATWE